MENTLIKSDKFNGRYVAVKGFDDQTVVGDGKNPNEAYEKAVKNGYKDPVVLFVPIKNMVQIY